MFNIQSFIVTNIVNGVKNNTFSREYASIMAVNYLLKGVLSEENIADIDAQLTAWELEKETVIEENIPVEELDESVTL